MTAQKSLLSVLAVLQRTRESCIQDFLEENVAIFRPSFRFEAQPAALRLAIESYLTTIINRHWTYIEDMGVAEHDRDLFNKAMARMLDDYQPQNEAAATAHSSLFATLLEEKQAVLHAILGNVRRLETRENELRYAIEKDHALFEREIKRHMDMRPETK